MTIPLPTPTLKARLDAGGPVGCHWMSLGSPALVELAAAAGVEVVVMDMQHGLWDQTSLEAAVAAAGTATPLARTADQSAHAISSALDAGAHGVIAPLVNSAAECAAVIAAARFPPHGRRSAGGVRPMIDFSAYRAAAQHILVSVMIETAEGLAEVEAIAATPGLDMIFIGSGDLSLALGAGPGEAVFEAALRRVRDAGRAAQVPVGTFTPNLEQALKRAGEGFTFVVIATDVDLNLGKLRELRRTFAQDAGPPPR
jgi:2-keto-3-deoxy-L-rhamnonate aldolase RhmA